MTLRQIRVLFDSHVDEYLINLHRRRTPFEVMPELVRDYRVQAMVDGNWRDLAVVRDNRRRLPLRGLSRGPSWPPPPMTSRTTSGRAAALRG